MSTRVVARFNDGSLVKGTTSDFSPAKEAFHIDVRGASPDLGTVRVDTSQLKALFFVKDLDGNPQKGSNGAFGRARRSHGHAVLVEFEDGEMLIGSTVDYRTDREGFFVEPADAESNNERCYVIAAATRDVRFLVEAPWERQHMFAPTPLYA